jgi:plastocyanin
VTRKAIHQLFLLLAWALMGMGGLGVAQAGDIAGTVRFTGEAPAMEPLHPTADHAVCGPEARLSGALIVSAAGEIKNAVAFIAHERMEGWRSPTTFSIDQRRCAFVPRVLIVPPGSTVEVLNSDGILHNFHTVSRLNPALNLAQPARARPLRITLEHPEIVQVKCDIHGTGFMRAWIVVAAHPYYALTDDEGRFRLADVPQGPHTLEVWHELLGAKRVPVSVGASGETRVSVTFTRRDALSRP